MYILKINSEFYYQIDTGMLHLKKKSEPLITLPPQPLKNERESSAPSSLPNISGSVAWYMKPWKE